MLYGPVEWSVLIFVCSTAAASFGIAWRVRGLFFEQQTKVTDQLRDQKAKHDQEIAGLHNAMQERTFAVDLVTSDLIKDVRHLKANLAQHAENYAAMHEDSIRTEDEVKRIGNIVNHRTAPTPKRR